MFSLNTLFFLITPMIFRKLNLTSFFNLLISQNYVVVKFSLTHEQNKKKRLTIIGTWSNNEFSEYNFKITAFLGR
jgi:hypothetical protein